MRLYAAVCHCFVLLPGVAVISNLDAALFAAGFVSWVLSTLSAGGGSLLILATASHLLEAHAVAPVVTVASLMSGAARVATLWRHIQWRVVRWYFPGAAIGAAAGGWLFYRIGARWIELLLATFLVSTIWQFRWGERARSFPMSLPSFVPVSLCSGLISAVIGASGLLANPFYLNYGLIKEEMLATRAVNSLGIQVVKIASYWIFGAFALPIARHGLAAGLGAVAGILTANALLAWLTARRFRQLALLAMMLAGLMLFWRQRSFISALLNALS